MSPERNIHYQIAAGCRWLVTFKLAIPDSWLSGAYKAEFNTSLGTQTVIFFVRERSPGTYSKALVVPSTNTWNAYNSYGGRSLYEYNSSLKQRSYKVSFMRITEKLSYATKIKI